MPQFWAGSLSGDFSGDKPLGEVVRAPRLLSVRLHPELADLLDRFAASQNVTAETIIAEAVRAYLGADA